MNLEKDSQTPSRSYEEQQSITGGLMNIIALLTVRLGGDVRIDASDLRKHPEVFAFQNDDGSVRLLERNHVQRETAPVPE